MGDKRDKEEGMERVTKAIVTEKTEGWKAASVSGE